MASADKTAIKLQKMANNSSVKIQKMVDASNKQMRDFNANEAKKQRDFNKQEAALAREFNKQEASTARQFNADEAQKARDWEKMMSDTSHQREVEDLRKAGLNPVLSVNSGANSYTTSSASAAAASANNASANNASVNQESGAGAYGSIMSSALGSMTSLAATQTSAAAQIKAAEISANASKYVADMRYKEAMDKPQGSPFGLADKYLNKLLKSGNVQRAYDYLSKKVNSFDNENLRALKKGSFALSNKRGDIDDCAKFLKRSFGINLNDLSMKDRKKAAQGLWYLSRSKTVDIGFSSLKNLSKKYK